MKLILFLTTLFALVTVPAAEVFNGDTYTGAGGQVTFGISLNVIPNDVDVNGGSNSTTSNHGEPGANSSLSNPSCENCDSFSVDHDNDDGTPRKSVKIENGTAKIKNDAGDWVTMKKKKKPKRPPGAKPPQDGGGSSNSMAGGSGKLAEPPGGGGPSIASAPGKEVTSLPFEVADPDGLAAPASPPP